MSMQQSGKRIIIIMCIAVCMTVFGGCADKKKGDVQQDNKEAISEATTETGALTEEITTEKAAETEVNEPATEEEGRTEEQQTTEPEAGQLPDLFPRSFTFASGAGGWGTVITLNQDGSFEGEYHDSEMGSAGDEYPYGSIYICRFSGRFDEIKKVNDYTYSMTLGELNIKEEQAGEWIEDGIRYIASEPYGLESGTEFLFYMPEAPYEELSENFLSWNPQRYLQDENPTGTLSGYGICNIEMGYGFFSFDY